MKYLAFSLIKPDQTTNLPRPQASQTELDKILTIAFVIIGSMSLMLLVIAGFRYVISGGDATKIADAKKTIIYTFVGLILSASAVIIVNAVLGQTTQGTK